MSNSTSPKHNMTDLNYLIALMGTMSVDPDGPRAIMCELTSRLTQTTLDSNRQNRRVAYYYALNLAEVPSTFIALSLSDLENPSIQSVLTRYAHWFDAEDTQLLYESLPDDAWELDILSRAMVGLIIKRAQDGDGRMPPCAPQDHLCGPFWSRATAGECLPC